MEQITKEEREFIDAWIDLCSERISLIEETKQGWEEWVTKPVVKNRLSPRQARTILEIFGLYANKGYDILSIVRTISTHSFLQSVEKNKEEADAKGQQEEDKAAEP